MCGVFFGKQLLRLDYEIMKQVFLHYRKISLTFILRTSLSFVVNSFCVLFGCNSRFLFIKVTYFIFFGVELEGLVVFGVCQHQKKPTLP